MVKLGLKNYFKSLKYFFMPLGTMFLGMMIGFSILLPGAVSAANQFIDGIRELSGSLSLNFGALFDEIWASVKSLDWNNPTESMQLLLTSEWINDTLTSALQSILGTNFETFKASITELIVAFTQRLTANLIVFLVFWMLGFLFGFALLKILIRRNIAKRSVWKFVLAYFLNALLSTALVVLCLYIFALWNNSIYISTILVLLLSGLFDFLQAYLLYGYKIVKLKDVVNAKNLGLNVLTDFLIFLISVAFTLIALAINNLMGLFVGLALAAIAFIVMGLNAESYVQDTVEKTRTLSDEV